MEKEKLKVPQSCFHIWLVLIKYLREKQNQMTLSLGTEFYDLYYQCWVFHKTEEEILSLTKQFIKNYVLESKLKSKEYYWELSEKEKNFSDGLKWVWMYNEIKEMVSKDSDKIKKYIKIKYSKEEIDWSLEWNDELFD